MKREKDRQLSMQELFDSILDVYDRTQIQTVISKASAFKDRQFIINKIMQRREEIKNAEQFVQFSRCAPLVNRFMKKMRQIKKEPDLKDPSTTTTNPANRRSSIETTQKLSNDHFKQSDPTTTSAAKSRKKSTPINDNSIPKIVFLNEYNSQQQQQQNPIMLSELPDTSNSSNETPKKDTLTSQKSNGFGQDSAENLLKKGIALSIFFKMKGKQSQSAEEISFQQQSYQQKLNQQGSIPDSSTNQNDLSQISSTTPSAIKRSQTNILRKTIIQRDNMLSRKTTGLLNNSNEISDAFESNLNAINMLSVSQSSRELEIKGKIQSIERANALLKDFQKANLASHFKSKSLNQQQFNRSEINTFNFKNKLLLAAKKPQAKTQSLHENQMILSPHAHAFPNCLTLSERQDTMNVVENELVSFVSKQEHPSNLLSSKSMLRQAEMNRIEEGARKKLQSKLLSTSQSSRNISLNALNNFTTKAHPYLELPSTASSSTTRKFQPSFFLESKPCSPKLSQQNSLRFIMNNPKRQVSANDRSEQCDGQQGIGIPSCSEIAPRSNQQKQEQGLSTGFSNESKQKPINKYQQLAQMLIPIRKQGKKEEGFMKAKQTQSGSFKRATFKQPFRMNVHEVFSAKSNFMEQQCIKFVNNYEKEANFMNSDLQEQQFEQQERQYCNNEENHLDLVILFEQSTQFWRLEQQF